MAERLTPTTQCTRILAEEDILVKNPFPPAGPPRDWGGDPSSFPCSTLGVTNPFNLYGPQFPDLSNT